MKDLAGVIPSLSLPADRPSTAAPRHAAVEKVMLPKDLTSSLSGGSTPDRSAPTYLAAFAALVQRYSGADLILLGLSVDSSTIVPSSIDVSGDPRFRELLDRVEQGRADELRTAAHRGPPQPPFANGVPQSPPTFQVVFGYSSCASSGTRSSLADRSLSVGAELGLWLTERDGEFECGLAYDPRLFDSSTALRILDHFRVLLEGIAVNREERLSALPILPDGERRLLEEWGRPAPTVEPSSTRFLHEAFQAQAEKTPDSVAIEYQERRLTYRELDEQSNRLAHYLRRRGVGPDVRVGIALERSPDLVIGLLAILKAGGAFVPFEPSHPAGQSHVLLAQTDPALVVTHSGIREGTYGDEKRIVRIDREREAIAAEPSSAPAPGITGDNLASVLFSSGSTGAPKAIPRAHRSLAVGPLARSPFRLTEADIHLLKATLDSTLVVREVFWPLASGGRIVIAPPGENNDVAALLRLLLAHRITFLTLAPSLLRMLVEEEGFETCRSLRHVTSFGEPLPADLEKRFCRRSAAELSSFYGTTEASSLCLRHCRSAEPGPLGNLGWRLGTWELRVLDASLQPVPIGVPGELFAGGPKLAEGYLDRPDLTAERFIPNPLGENGKDRLYRTGDRVRWRPDGSLEFLGRLDDQIKVRGYRVEPAEIEAALLRHPDVGDAAVTTRPNRRGEHQLAAFLVPRREGLTVNELRQHLRGHLPPHMVPAFFVRLAELPRRPNGKLDRRALADASGVRLELATSCVTPRTPLEADLAAAWSDVLEVERVGVHDDFFLLGGNSLLAARLSAQWRASHGAEIPLRDLFETPTIAGIAGLLERRTAADTPASISPAPGRLRPSVDSDAFCEVIRSGPGGMPVVCIGDSRPIPFLLARLPADVPILHAKLDGTHVWPPSFLTIEEQVEACLPSLVRDCGFGAVVLVGFSYGGLLAHRLAAALLEEEQSVGGVMLIEPSLPHRHQSLWHRWRWRLRRALRSPSLWTAASGPPQRDVPKAPSNGSLGMPDIKTRWNTMEAHYRRNVETVQLGPLGTRVALVGSSRYHARFAGAWRCLETAGIEECILTSRDDHVSCFREPHASRWLDFLEEWYSKLPRRREATTGLPR